MAYAILRKEDLNPQIFLMEIHAPAVAKKAEPGQFIILRIDEYAARRTRCQRQKTPASG